MKDRLNDLSIPIVIIVVAGAAIVGWFSHVWLGDDNEVEEISEQIIESQTGQDVDLTPSSPEKKKTVAESLEEVFSFPSSSRPRVIHI